VVAGLASGYPRSAPIATARTTAPWPHPLSSTTRT